MCDDKATRNTTGTTANYQKLHRESRIFPISQKKKKIHPSGNHKSDAPVSFFFSRLFLGTLTLVSTRRDVLSCLW